jgi:fibronectin-binding autotransporter adhesin
MQAKNGVRIGWIGLALAVAMTLGSAGTAQATTTNTWTNTVAGTYNWSAAANWTNGAVPASGSGTVIQHQEPASGGGTFSINNDIANPFTLNKLRFFNTGGGNSTTYAINFTGGDLSFAADGATAPAIQNDAYANYLTLTVSNNIALANSDLALNNNAGNWAANLVLAGSITGTGNITKSGSGTGAQAGAPFRLNGNKTFTGNVTANSGALYLGGTNAWTGNLTVNNTATVYPTTTNDNYTGTTTVDAGGALYYNTSGTFTRNIVNNGTVGINNVSGLTLTLSGLISGSGGVYGGVQNTLILSNTTNSYTGVTSISGNAGSQVLQVYKLANGGQNSSIGASSAVASNLVLAGNQNTPGTTLRYMGAGDNTDRLLTGTFNGPSGFGIENNGTGPLNFTSTGNIVYGNTNASGITFFLGGTYAGGVNTFAPVIGNNGTNGISFKKDGVGTWALTSANSYTGTTRVANGTLRGTLGTGGTIGSGNLNIEPDTYGSPVFESGADIVRPGGSGAGQMRITGVTYIGGIGAGFSACGGDINVCFGSLASPEALTWNVAPFQPYGSYGPRYWFTLNASTGTNTLNFRNPVSLNGVTGQVTTAAGVAIMSGALTGGPGSSLDKYGAGVLWLTGTNTYPGATRIYGGVLRAVDGIGIPAGGGCVQLQGGVWESDTNMVRVGGNGAGQMLIGGNANGGFSAAGTGTVQVAFGTLGSPTNLTLGTSPFQPGALILNAATATGTLDFKNPIYIGNGTLSVKVDASTAIMSGVLSGGASGNLMKLGGGTLRLTNANTYVNGTTVSNGVLVAGHANALGTGATTVKTNATLAIASGVTYTRAVTFEAGSALAGQGTFTTNNWTTPTGLTLQPGLPAGTLTVNVGGAGNTLTLGANNVLRTVIQPDGVTYGKLTVTGALDISAPTARLVVSGTMPASKIVLAEGTTSRVGQFLAGNVDLSGLTGSGAGKAKIYYTATQVLLGPPPPGTAVTIR